MEKAELRLDLSGVLVEVGLLNELLAKPIPFALDGLQSVGNALDALIDFFESAPYVVDIKSLAASGTVDGCACLHFTEEFRELMAALRAAYRDIGVGV